MSVKEILESYLKEHGFDGLYAPGGECACLIGDLVPCDANCFDCEAGYKAPCPGPESCTAGGGCDFHITPEKP